MPSQATKSKKSKRVLAQKRKGKHVIKVTQKKEMDVEASSDENQESVRRTRSGNPRVSFRSVATQSTNINNSDSSKSDEPPVKKGKGIAKMPTKEKSRASSRRRSMVSMREVSDLESEDNRSEDSDESNESDKVTEGEYEVHSIVDVRHNRGKVEYKVRWKGYAVAHSTWEPANNLNCDKKIEEFKKKNAGGNKEKSRDLRKTPKQTCRYVEELNREERHRMRGRRPVLRK